MRAWHSRMYCWLTSAGRLAIDDEMMAEIKALHEAVDPIETLFVVDAMTGQDAANAAKAFGKTLPLTGVILTKVDRHAGWCGAVVRTITERPIKFLGIGEKTDALDPFHPDRLASRILGMGDMLSLIEEVERKVDHIKPRNWRAKSRRAVALIQRISRAIAANEESGRHGRDARQNARYGWYGSGGAKRGYQAV